MMGFKKWGRETTIKDQITLDNKSFPFFFLKKNY